MCDVRGLAEIRQIRGFRSARRDSILALRNRRSPAEILGFSHIALRIEGMAAKKALRACLARLRR
jgi:hypothetical protein